MEQFPEQPTCINLNCERPVVYSHTKKSGAKRWRPVCGRCHMASYGAKPLDEGIVEVKKTYCENIDGRLNDYKCTTTIPYKGALELDHIDGNVLNNFPDNIQTLCKVCHSYKSHLSNDFKKNRVRLLKEAEKRKADREEPLGEFFKSCLSPEEKKKQEMEKDKMIDYE